MWARACVHMSWCVRAFHGVDCRYLHLCACVFPQLWSAPKQQFLQPSSAPSPAPSLTTGRLTPMIPLPPEYIPHTEELNQSHVISLGKARLPSPTRTVGVMSSDLSAYHPIAFNPSSAASQPSSVSSVRGMQGGYRNVAATARLSASGGNRRLNKKKLVDRRRRSTVTVGVRPPRSPSRGSETRPQPSTSTSAGGGDGHWVYVPPSAPVSMRAPSPAQAPIPLSPAAVPAVVQLSNGQWAIPLSALGLGGGGGGGGEAFRTAPQQGTVQQRLIPARTMTPQGGVRVGTPLF